MASPSEEVRNAIQEAIRLEIRGRAFYTHAAETTENTLGKKMFQRLAEDEVEHLKVFGKLFTTILEGGDWKQYARGANDQTEAPLIEKLKKRMEEKGNKSDLEAVAIGMELERNAMDHFAKAAKEAQDPVAREIFAKIAEQEQLHYDLLQAQYDSVANTGVWFDTAEFYMDGKY